VLTVVSVLTVRQVTGQQPENRSGKRCADQVSNQGGFHLHTMGGQKLLYNVIRQNIEKVKKKMTKKRLK